MQFKDDLRFAELIAARMSHDLVGPVGAAVNGVELLAEGESADAEVLRLIGQSARQASRRLQVFRAIYGTPGALPTGTPFAAAMQLFEAMLVDDKVSLAAWDIAPALDVAAGRTGARIALLAGFVLTEALPRGGNLRLMGTLQDRQAILEFQANGVGARVFEDVGAALAGKLSSDSLSPKTVPAGFLGRLLLDLGGRNTLTAAKDQVSLVLRFSATGDG